MSLFTAIAGGAHHPPPSIVLVQQKVGTVDNGNLIAITFDNDVTGGNLLIVCLSHAGGALGMWETEPGFTLGIADPPLLVDSSPAGLGPSLTSYIYASLATDSGAAAFNARLDGSVRINVNISEWAILDSATAEDSDVAEDAGNTITTGLVDPTTSPNLVIAIGAFAEGDSSGPTNGFTRMTPTGGAEGGGGGAVYQECAYRVRDADHTAIDTGFEISSSAEWATVIAAFGG